MKYIKRLTVLAIAVVISVSGFSAVAEKSKNSTLKTEKIVAEGKKEFKKLNKKNFKKMSQRKKVELTEEEKAAKLEEFKKDLAEKLSSGKITQEQYDKMLASFENGKMPQRFKKPGREKVELTEEEKAAKLEEFKKDLAEKLSSGKITQEQYDKMLASFENGKMLQRFKKPSNPEGRNFPNRKNFKPNPQKTTKE